MSEQADAVQCEICERWFRSRGVLAVHRCRRPEESPDSGGGTAAAPQGQVVCRECGRTFSRQGDLKRHKCLLETNRPVEERAHCATDGLGVVAALVCTREDSMQQKAETCSFLRKDT